MNISISRNSLLQEIGDAAFVEADLREGERDAHSLHHTFDVCNEENRLRVGRMLCYSYSEACRILRRAGGDVSACGRGGSFRFRTTLRSPDSALLGAALREYLVASVMWGWLRHTLPEAAESWRQRREEAAGSLRDCARRSSVAYRRRVEPF